jgi:plasmid stabilization system protein ParE
MARSVVFRPAAERDLAALYAYVRDANGGPEIAIGYVRRIRDFCESLEPFPERGVARDDIRPGLRLAHFEKRVVVAFTISPEQVRIGRIFYGGRDYEALLGKDAGS